MKKLLLILIPFMLLAADGDTLEYNSDYTDFADGDTFFVDVQFKPPFDSIQSIINGRLGNVNIADDAEIDVNKLDTLDTLITKGLRTTYLEVDTLKKIDSGYISIFVADTVKENFYVVNLTSPDIDVDTLTVDSAIIIGDSADIFTVDWTDYSATSTIVGFTSYTTKQIWYKKVGALVFVNFNLAGTSDATTLSFTLPFTSNARNYTFCCVGIDNGSELDGNSGSISNSNIVNIITNQNHTTTSPWTTSGTKASRGQFWYEATR